MSIEKLRKRLAELFRIARQEGALRKYADDVDDAEEALRACADEGLGWQKKLELPRRNPDLPRDSDWNYKYWAFGDVCRDAQQDMLEVGFTGFKPLEGKDGISEMPGM